MPENVVKVFNSISSKYDLLDFMISFGMDRSWRKDVVRELSPVQGSTVLDCGSGTGKLAYMISRKCRKCRIICLDITESMFRRDRLPDSRFIVSSALSIPLEDESVDYVSSAFLTRNVGDVRGYFSEVHRVLRKGGRFANLDIYNPAVPVFRDLFRLYFYTLVPAFGDIATRSDSYSYLSRSVQKFHSPDQVSSMLEDAGFRNIRRISRALSVINIHSATK